MNERELFAVANSIPDPAERAAFLDRECVGRPELRRQVNLLIAAEPESESLLDSLFVSSVATAADPAKPAEPFGARLKGGIIDGRFRLIERLESESLETWSAEQLHPVERKTLLQFINVEPNAAVDSLSAIIQDRRAIDRLDHREFARIIDAGQCAEKAIYVASEFAPGRPAPEFCDLHEWTIEERVELFARVCRTFREAHSKGVLHLHLGSANILVKLTDGSPTFKVTGFGFSRTIDGVARTTTAPHGFDARSDVSALGAILYELVAGGKPVGQVKPSARISKSANAARIAEHRRTTLSKLVPLIAADLDDVVMKALSVDPAGGYQTVHELLQDVERFLDAKPVGAGKETAARKMTRVLVRRPKLVAVVGFAAAALLLGAAGAVRSTMDSCRAIGFAEAESLLVIEMEAARRHAAAERDRADAAARRKADAESARNKALQQADSSLRALFAAAEEESATLNREGRDATDEQRRRAILLLHRLRAVAEGMDPDEELDRRRAETGLAIAKVFRALDMRNDAVAEVRSACARMERVCDRGDSSSSDRALLADCCLAEGAALVQFDKPAEGAARIRAGVEILRKLAAESAADMEPAESLARGQRALGNALTKAGRPDEAISPLQDAITATSKFADGSPNRVERELNLADCRSDLANAFQSLGRIEDAVAERSALVERLANVVEKHPDRVEATIRLADAHRDLAALLEAAGDLEWAFESRIAALELHREVVERHPRRSEFRRSLGEAFSSLANLFALNGWRQEALAEHQSALACFQRLCDEDSASVLNQEGLHRCRKDLAELCSAMNLYDEAGVHRREACETMRRLFDRHPQRPEYARQLGLSLADLSMALRRVGRADESRSALSSALKLQEEQVAARPNDPGLLVDLARAVAFQAEERWSAGKAAEAVNLYSRSVEVLERVGDLESQPSAVDALCESLWGRSQALAALARTPRALRDADRAVALAVGPKQLKFRAGRAALKAQVGDPEGAVADADELVRLAEWSASDWFEFACVYASAAGQRPSIASTLAAQAVQCLEHSLRTGFNEVERVRSERRLDPIRKRDEFVKWAAKLANGGKAPSPPVD